MPPKKKLVAADSTLQPKKILQPKRKSSRLVVQDSSAANTTPCNLVSNDIKIKNELYDNEVRNTVVKSKKGRASLTKLAQERKIALANEVVQAHFSKQDPFEQTPVARKPLIKKPVLKRKYTRNKKNIIKNGTEGAQQSTDVNQDSDSPGPKRKEPRIVQKNSNLNIAITVDNSGGNINPPKDSKLKLTPRKKLTLKRKKIFKGLVRTVVNDYIPESNTNLNVNDTPPVEKESNDDKNKSQVKKDKEHKENQDKDIKNQEVNSRRSSLMSSTELSWTKDISSSSTTTCVTVMSNDFFRIDNKIPFIKLTKVCDILPTTTETEESSDTSDTSSESDSSIDNQIQLDISKNPLNLSVSSSSSEKSTRNNERSVHDKILDVFKTFNPDDLNWTSGHDDIKNNDEFKEELAKEHAFQDELVLLSMWLNITNLVSEDSNNITPINAIVNNSCDTTVSTNIHERNDENPTSKSKSEKDICKTKNVEDDDDDALSLFAESITGIDSNRRNSIYNNSEMTEVEEYVPQPIKEDVFKKPKPVIYNPSKVIQLKQTTNPSPTMIVCEKQSADSTSLRNDLDFDVRIKKFKTSSDLEHASINNYKTSSESSKSDSDEPRKVLNVANIRPVELVKSAVLRGVCAFNLIGNCKNSKCKFPHTYPDENDVKHKLEWLKDDIFIQEYLLVRNLVQLRRLCGLCFIDDCVRRKLTGFLIKMSMDFIVNTNDENITDVKLKTEAVERTLLYLNFIDLDQYSDLLKHEISPGVLLCDIYMHVIAQSQNFYRFRTVFINLAMFMCRIDRSFHSDVACQVLERVCILPYEFSLTKTLIEILKKTDPIVLSNSMSGHLEKRLMCTNQQLYDEFVRLKQLVTNEDSQTGVMDKDIRYSPDTTNFDNMNKLQEEFTRTTDINKKFPNRYKIDRRYKSRRGPKAPQPSKGVTNRLIKRKPLPHQPPVNNFFIRPIFPPRQNPGYIIRTFIKKR